MTIWEVLLVFKATFATNCILKRNIRQERVMTRLLLGWVIINVNVDLRQDNTRGQHKWSVNSGSWRNILTEAWSWQKYNFELSRLSSVSCPSQCWTSQYVVHHNFGHYSMLDITMSDITILDISVCCPSQFGTSQYVGHLSVCCHTRRLMPISSLTCRHPPPIGNVTWAKLTSPSYTPASNSPSVQIILQNVALIKNVPPYLHVNI